MVDCPASCAVVWRSSIDRQPCILKVTSIFSDGTDPSGGDLTDNFVNSNDHFVFPIRVSSVKDYKKLKIINRKVKESLGL